MKKFLRKSTIRLGVGFASAVLLSLLFRHAWPLLLFSAFTLVLYIPLPKKLSTSSSLRVMLSVLLLLSIIQLEALIGYILGFDLNPFIYGTTNALLIACLAIFVPRSDKIRWTLDDVWVFAVPLLVVGGLLFSMFTLTAKDNTDIEGAIIHKITTTSDESNHINVFAQSIVAGGDMKISPTSYPSGWHVATAVTVSSFVDLSDKPFINIVAAYYIMKLLGVFLATASIMILIIAVSRLILKGHVYYYLLFALTTFFLCLALIIPNSEINGFYNFVPQYAYFLLTFLMLLYVRDNVKIVLPILVVFIIGGFISWIISGLMLFGIVLVSMLTPALAKIQIRDRLLVGTSQLVILGVLLLGVFLISLPSGIVGHAIDTLEHPGGWVEGYNLITYPVLLLLLVSCGLLNSKSKLSLQFRTGLISFFVVVGMVFVVTTLRGYGGDQMSYYWQKMLFPLLPVAVTVLVVLAAQKLGELVKHVVVVYTIIVLLIILLAPFVLGHSSFDLSLRVIGNQNFLHKTQNSNIDKPLEVLFKNNHFNSDVADRYIFVTSGNYTLDQMVYQLMSRSISDNSETESCLPPYYGNGGFYGNNMVRLESVKSEYCGHKVKIIVSNDTVQEVRRYSGTKDLINIDTDF